MTKNLLSALLIALLIPFGTLNAQECFPTWITLDSFMQEGGPSWVEWGLQNDQGELLFDGIAQYTSDDPYYEEDLCLEAGCYQLIVAAEETIPEGAVFFWIGVEEGFIDTFESTYDGSVATIEFCIAAPQPCELEVAIDPATCNSWNFIVTEVNPNADIIEWFVNDQPFATGTEFFFQTDETGTYQICAAYETPDCPEGVFWCETFVVGPDCFGQECPDEIIADNPVENCYNYIFQIDGVPNEYTVTWTIGDNESYTDGTITDHVFEEDGIYEVCAFIETPDCPEGTEICSEVVVNCANNCELDVFATQLDCSPITLEASNYPEDALIEWFVNDDFNGTGEIFMFEAPEAGTYQICAAYETPDCPEGVLWCETFVVGPDCFDQGCPDEIIAENPVENCYNYIFQIDGVPNEYTVTWTIGDNESYTDGTITDHVFEEDGIYEVCAFIETPDCPEGTEICIDLEVNCSDDDCPSENFYTEGDCLNWVFEIGSFQEGEIAIWNFGDGTVFTGGHFTTHEYTEPGTYEVCVEFTSDLCPEGVYACQEIVVEECDINCELDVFATQLDCSPVTLEASNYPEDAIIEWFVNGDFYSTGQVFTFEAPEAGSYQICGQYNLADCGGEIDWCETFTFSEDCFGQECPDEIVFESQNGNCNDILFTIPGLGEDAVVEWYIADLPSYPGASQTEYVFPEDGTYTVCAFYETPDCPLGVETCTEVVIDCENPEDCYLDIDAELVSSDTFIFGAQAPDDAVIFWTANGEPIGEGNVLTYIFDAPGDYEVCASYETPDCPMGVTECVNIAVLTTDDEDCTGFSLVLETDDDLPLDVDLSYLLEGFGLEFGGDVTLYTESGTTILEACLPDGCWEVTVSMDEFEEIALYLAILIEGGLELDYDMDFSEQTVTLEFGINADCGTGINEAGYAVSVFPNPATDRLIISGDLAAGTPYQLVDMTGRAVLNGSLRGVLTTIDVSVIPAGMYLLHWTEGGKLHSQRIQVGQ
jgi:hypothetical protein